MALKDPEEMSQEELEREVTLLRSEQKQSAKKIEQLKAENESLREELARRDRQAFEHNLRTRGSTNIKHMSVGDGKDEDT